MRRILPLGVLLFALCAFPASAILDTNSNGLSDLWERAYNGGDLFASMNPLTDDDSDGWTNAQEAAAGTSPFDANPPDGLIRPETNHIPEVLGVSPEVIQVTWPQIPGKSYTVFFSPDLVDWLPVGETFIGSETEQVYNFPLSPTEGQPTPPDKQFWRIKIEDVDSDGDGLTDAEEHDLGTDPSLSETIAGYPDMWLAQHYLDVLLNGGLLTIGPDGDPDSDGLTNAQEDALDTEPNVSDNPGIVQESIRNGDFSIPGMDNQDGLNKDVNEPGWNYWAGLPELPNAHSWTAVIGTNIEYQIKEPIDTNNPYCELKAEPEDHYGIKQQVGTRIGITYLLALDCKARQNTTLANNEFSVKIDGSTVQSITPTSTWTTRAVSFKATNVITEISLVPESSPNDKMGCLVDNVILLQVDITVRKKTEADTPPTGLCVNKNEIITFDFNGSSPASVFPLSSTTIQWQIRQLKRDGNFNSWTTISGVGCEVDYSTPTAGIFQAKAILTLPGQAPKVFEYKRKKDEPNATESHGNYNEIYRKGQPDYFGTADTDAQISTRWEARRNLGSTAYATTATLLLYGGGPTLGDGDSKCNAFVFHKASDGGAIVPLINTGSLSSTPIYPPLAYDWWDITKTILHWERIPDDEFPQPGYVVAGPDESADPEDDKRYGHCGILDYDGAWLQAGTLTVSKFPHLTTALDKPYQPAGFRKY